MAGHSKFSNIKHRKAIQDNKRGKIFTKILHEIRQALKFGSDFSQNPRLRSIVSKAKSYNIPKDKIEKAVHTFANDKLQEFYLEAFISGVAFIIQVCTNNKNDIISKTNSILKKFSFSLSSSGSVKFLFLQLGVVSVSKEKLNDKVLSDILELNIKGLDFEEQANRCLFFCDPYQVKFCYDSILKIMKDTVEDYSVIWKAKNEIFVEDNDKLDLIKRVCSSLKDLDEVEDVFLNCNI